MFQYTCFSAYDMSYELGSGERRAWEHRYDRDGGMMHQKPRCTDITPYRVWEPGGIYSHLTAEISPPINSTPGLLWIWLWCRLSCLPVSCVPVSQCNHPQNAISQQSLKNLLLAVIGQKSGKINYKSSSYIITYHEISWDSGRLWETPAENTRNTPIIILYYYYHHCVTCSKPQTP